MKFCQSCAMPLSEPGQYGTESDGSRSGDYCCHCYQTGVFTGECTMEEMIEFCAGPMAEANPGMDAAQAKAKMREFFPALKRWAE